MKEAVAHHPDFVGIAPSRLRHRKCRKCGSTEGPFWYVFPWPGGTPWEGSLACRETCAREMMAA